MNPLKTQIEVVVKSIIYIQLKLSALIEHKSYHIKRDRLPTDEENIPLQYPTQEMNSQENMKNTSRGNGSLIEFAVEDRHTPESRKK